MHNSSKSVDKKKRPSQTYANQGAPAASSINNNSNSLVNSQVKSNTGGLTHSQSNSNLSGS